MRSPRAIALVVALAFASQLSAADKRPMTMDDFFAVKRRGRAADFARRQSTSPIRSRKWISRRTRLSPRCGSRPPTARARRSNSRRRNVPGRRAAVVAGRKAHSVRVEGRAVRHGRRRREAGAGREHQHRGEPRHLVAGRQAHRVRVERVTRSSARSRSRRADKLNKDKDDEIANSPVKAKTFTKLFYRHWVEYVGDKRQHIFVVDLAQGLQSPGRAARCYSW